MSKLKRLLGVLSIVSLFTFSSCVDDTVSPEVTALRNAQVALLNANTSVEQATAALINANVAAQTIANTFNSANNAILLQLAQIKADSAAAQLEVVLAEAETTLAEEALKLLEAAKALEVYANTAGLVEAAQYLAQWNVIMYGGTLSADNANTIGIVATRNQIYALQSQIARAQLYLGGNATDKTRESWVLGQLELALTNANNAVTTNEAMITTRTEQLANNPDPTTALKDALLNLAKDTVANKNTIAAIEKEIQVIGAESTKADSIKKSVRGQHMTSASNVPNGANWYNASENLKAANAKVAEATKQRTAFTTYGNGLKAVYDKYFPQVQALETKYAELEAAKKAASDAIPSNSASQLANQIAFANYVVAENNFRRKGAANTVSDTNTYVAARRAWDGLTKAQLFYIRTNAQGGSILIEARAATNATLSGAAPQTYEVKGGVNALSDLRAATPDNGSGVGVDDETGTAYPAVELTEGTLNTLLAGANESLTEALNKADFELRVYHLAVGNVVVEFRNLKSTYEATLSTSTATEGAAATASTSTTKFVGFNVADVATNITFVTDYKAELAALTFPTSVDFTFTNAIGVSNDPALADITANSARSTNIALARANTSVTRHTASVALYAPFVAPYLTAYNAALLVNSGRIDSLKIEPTVRLFAAKDVLKANISAMNDIQNQINLVNQQSGGVVPATAPATGFTFGKTIEQLRAEWTADRTARRNNRTALNLAVEVATNNIAEHAINKTEATAMIARMEADLAAKQTQLTVLEALLAEYQALVLAAIGG